MFYLPHARMGDRAKQKREAYNFCGKVCDALRMEILMMILLLEVKRASILNRFESRCLSLMITSHLDLPRRS